MDSFTDDLINQGYTKGRTETFKEIIKMINEMEENYRAQIRENDCMEDDPFSDGILSAVFSIITAINQLKEQKK